MSVIRHWWITAGADGRGFLAYDDPNEALAVLGKHEESEQVIEVVPAPALRGAVEEIERLRAALQSIAVKPRPSGQFCKDVAQAALVRPSLNWGQ